MKVSAIWKRIRRGPWFAAGLLATAPAVTEEIHQYVDPRGRVTFSDRTLRDPSLRYVGAWTWKGWLRRNFNPSLRRLNRERFKDAIRRAARRYGLSEALVHAVIDTESSYDPNAVSSAGAVGLMQLMPATARRYGIENRLSPTQNMQGGTRYLSYLLTKFNDNLVLALAAYNAGENAVVRYGHTVPPYRETRKYVERVLDRYREYRKMFPEEDRPALGISVAR